MRKSELLAALAAAVALIPSGVKAEETAKCYGIAKAGKNDCASEAAGHMCGGHAKKDNDPNEWIKMSKEDCQKVGGVWKEDQNK